MISVVIPVYKVEPYIEDCIRSVINQTFQDWELILVDDGSPDRCGEICDRFAETDCRICVIHQKNAGLSAARNAGMKVIRGDYVTFVDSDDYIGRDHLSSLFKAINESGSTISIAGYRNVAEGGTPPEKETANLQHTVMTGREACARLMRSDETFMISAWGKLYSRELFTLIHYPEGRLNEDEYVTYRLLYESRRVSFTGENSYSYRKHGSSITASFTLKHLEVAEAFRGAITYFAEKQDEQMKTLAQKRFLLEIRVLYLKSESLAGAERDRLLAEWKEAYRAYYGNTAKISSFAERALNRFFFRFPILYFWVHKQISDMEDLPAQMKSLCKDYCKR